MNDPGFFDAARHLAARIMKKSPKDRAAYAFRLCTSRTPDREERERLDRAFARERKEASDLEAWTLVAEGCSSTATSQKARQVVSAKSLSISATARRASCECSSPWLPGSLSSQA